ncbi:MAG: hypothetical protein O7G88_17680 [bacterium]|nr:hypothetical protein [bacterium]
MIYRFIMTTLLLTFLVITWCLRAQATAFTFRLGPLPETDAAIPGIEVSDLPTPQLFRIAIDQEDVIFGVIHPSEGFGVSEPEIGLPETVVPQPVLASEERADNNPSMPYRLSGVELLLLRDTQVVAGQSNE